MEAERRERWLEAANREWGLILQDPVARAEVAAEQALWDVTLLDGLEDDPWETPGEDERVERPWN